MKFAMIVGSKQLRRLQMPAAIPEHPGQVKRSLVKMAFGRLRDSAIPVQVAVPFAVFGIGKMAKAPVVDQLMTAGIFYVIFPCVVSNRVNAPGGF